MLTYYAGGVYVTESEMYGRKYIGEAVSFAQSRSFCEEWQQSVLIQFEEMKMNDMREKIEKWIDAQETLRAAKEEEMELRKEICEYIQKEQPGFGTRNAEVAGFRLKAVFGLTYKIDKDKLEQLESSLSPEEKDCIKYTPSVDVTKFKAVESDLLNEIIFAQQAAPTLKVD